MNTRLIRISTTVAAVLSALVLLALASGSRPARAAGTISLTTLGTAYTQNFDTLANSGTSSTLPDGWYFGESGTNANTTYGADTGASNSGNTYSYGSSGSTERAFGGLQSGSLNPTIGANFVNNTGAAINQLTISYYGEQWRMGATGRQDRIDFQLSTDATSLTTGTWTNYDNLDFSSPTTSGTVGALDGNTAANRTAKSFAITSLNIANGATFWIRWSDLNVSGSDDGLAVDDFSSVPEVSGNPAGTGSANPNLVGVGGNSLLTVAVTPGTNPTSTGLTVTCDLSPIGGSATQQFYDDGTNGDATAGDNTFSYQATVAAGTSTGAKSLPCTIADAQARTGSANIALTAVPAPTAIHDLQGASHISPHNGEYVTTTGIVTALRTNGFFLQDPSPDADNATSEAIFVYTSSAPTVNVGDAVTVSGTVSEFRPGGSGGTTNLTTTEITSPTILVNSTGNTLPAPTVIGAGGRVPPNMVIEDDAGGDVETGGAFDPANDGIDFYESLEAMLVQINRAIAVGPTNQYGEIPVIADGGAGASHRTARGGIVVRPNDFNPERIILDDGIMSVPTVNVRDQFTTPIVGVLDYSFGNFKLLITQALTAVAGGLTQETTAPAGPDQLTVATFNVENLDPGDAQAHFDELAALIVNNLKSPDLISVEEIQDNNGATNDAVVDATQTYNQLIAAIQAAGGPTYQFRQIDPVDDQDGGEPGGNIRQGFMFRTDRGLSFVDRPGGTSTTGTTVQPGPRLAFSPGRIDPANAAFNSSRKPLAGEFMFQSHRFFVISNHFNSKGGDQPLFGHWQPPTLSSETQRNQQATLVHDFVNNILALDPNANVIVLGDLNDFEFSTPLATLKGTILIDLIETLPQSQRYSYVYDGNSQTLDHILVSKNLSKRTVVFDVVHVNAEFATQASDHDPEVARFFLPGADLRIGKQAQVGTLSNPITFRIQVTNLGKGIAQNVVIKDTLPNGLSYLRTIKAPPGCSFGKNNVRCALPRLLAGQTIEIAFVAEPHKSAVFTNCAQVSAATFDPDPTNDKACVDVRYP